MSLSLVPPWTGSSHCHLSLRCMPKHIPKWTRTSSRGDYGETYSSTREVESSHEKPQKKDQSGNSCTLCSNPFTSCMLILSARALKILHRLYRLWGYH